MIITATQADPHPRLWTTPEYGRLEALGFFRGQQVEFEEGEIILRAPEGETHARTWTKAEFYRLGELGFFQGQKAELWEGVIMVSSPQGPRHYKRLKRAGRVLEREFGDAFDIRLQGPLDLGLAVDPEPDVAVVPAVPDEYENAHPQLALLIVEISDSTLASDRGDKGSLYARGGIGEFWIVNLVDRQLEVYRNPQPDPAAKYGYSYADRFVLRAADAVTPLAAPDARISVADLLG